MYARLPSLTTSAQIALTSAGMARTIAHSRTFATCPRKRLTPHRPG
jgi:hypothetical protein